MRRHKIFLLLALVVGLAAYARVAETNSLVWQADRDLVSADIHGEALWPLLEDIAHQAGWHIFVEPGISQNASVKFRDLSAGEALHKLLGNLNFALVPQTNGPQQLYVFRTVMQNATLPVLKASPVVRRQRHVANELIVKLKPGADIDVLAKALGAKVVGRDDKLGIYRLQFSDAAATAAALASLQTNPDVAAVDYNYIFDQPIAPQKVANAPAGPVALTLDPNAASDPCNPVVGLIDTTMQSLGSQLDPFLLKAVNVTGDTTTPSATDPTHATAMAQTILRAVSQQGTSSSVRILPVDVYGASETTTSWNVALGVQAAVDGGATVLNLSLGAATDSPILDSIIQQALAKGVVIFAAAGNQPVSTPTYPAAIPGVNAVTALGAPGQLASYANFGSFVEMALPGASVVYLGNQAYVVQGTSPATAYATGVAAGTKGINCLPWAQIQSAMAAKFPVPQTGN
jgi:thermitase